MGTRITRFYDSTTITSLVAVKWFASGSSRDSSIDEKIIFFNIAILTQIFLGIITLVSGVEIKFASLHQLGSIFVLSSYFLILYKNTNQQL